MFYHHHESTVVQITYTFSIWAQTIQRQLIQVFIPAPFGKEGAGYGVSYIQDTSKKRTHLRAK